MKIREVIRINGLYSILVEDIDIVDNKEKVVATYKVAQVYNPVVDKVQLEFTTFEIGKTVSEAVKYQLSKIMETISGGF